MVQMSMIRPCLEVKDTARTLKFYENLGFKLVFRVPEDEPPVLIEMEFDRCKLLFHKGCQKGELGISGSIQLFVSDVGAFRASLPTSMQIGPIEGDHGHAQCLRIRDPDGYHIDFREPLDEHKKYFDLATKGA